MSLEKNKVLDQAMAFYHQDGLVAAWKQAMKFADKGGRIATMPDIVAARLASKPGDLPWETYFTTSSAEYYGIGQDGKYLLIVAHGVGPLATLDGILKAYSWQFNDKQQDRRGGRISAQEFLDLEAGKYGEVSIVDLEAYCQRYEYPFMQILRSSEAMTDPLLRARFGSRTEEYVKAHTDYARLWHRKQAGIDPENKYNLDSHASYLDRRRTQHARDGAEDSDPYIIEVEDESNLCYTYGFVDGHRCHRQLDDGQAIAHLLSSGGLRHMHHEGNESLTNEVGCHAWNDGVRLVGIKAGGSIRAGLNKGPDAHQLIKKHWCELLLSVKQMAEVGFRELIKVGDQWFTQRPRVGDGMDQWEPEFVVTSLEKIGEPVLFRTEIGGYHGFFKYGVKEVEEIAPPTANAYVFMGEVTIEWLDGNPMYHNAMTQFYRVTVDATQRLMREKELKNDYETMMKLLTK